ncbi:protoporphyrinogen/coproporphyrinogen oxidase [Pseudonocardia spinosispora]|uniref:protoporphyrinogen/coproporphyrinogen oxidase n=1 Tax=Pseudonocardia spinosispora TaxID=103441 RepID=UPI00040C1862|nr:FAD-dependent oxidoreductase [Pseudonocardia spinosispora]
MTARVIVVGGGIAGLSAAYRLREAGAEVTVLERANRVGGRMHTIERDGYRIDAAASVLPTTYRNTLRLIADAGLGGMVQPTSDVMGIAGARHVHRLHSRRRTGLLTTGLLGARSKLSLAGVLRDLYRHRRVLETPGAAGIRELDVESIVDYGRRHLTAEALDYFVQPLTGDFYLTPPDQLSVVNLFLLLRTMIGAGFVNSAEGIRFLPEGLARQLDVELSATVTEVLETAGGVQVTWERAGEPERVVDADAVVVAVPAVHVPSMLPRLDTASRDYLKNVPYARSLVVTLALRSAPDESAMWLTVPDRTHPDVNVMILDHNKAPGRVPPGAGLVTVYWHREWASRHWDLHDDQVLAKAIAGAAEVLPEIENQVVAGYVWRWDPCTVARPVGGYRALADFTAGLDPGSRIQLAGDYLRLTTVEDSLTSGGEAAARVIEQLGVRR